MRIVLVVTNSRRKNLVFSADTLKAYTLNEAVELAKRRALESVHSVKTGRGSYLRANPNPSRTDNLDALSISANHLYLSLNDFTCLLSLKQFNACKNHLAESILE